MKFILLTFCISFCISTQLYAQKKSELVKEVLDSNSYFFQHDMKYLGKSTNVSPNYQYVMESLYDELKNDRSLSVHIRGHVCCGPSKRISKKRARKTYRYLKKLGISKERISHMGYSDTRPLVFPEKTDEDAKKNRRVDFIITKH